MWAVNVILLEPSFPDNQKQFARALSEVGATVIGIGERPKDWLDDDVKAWLTHYEQVGSVTDDAAVAAAVRWVQDKLWVDRLEATVEAHTMTAARVREACSIPGTSVRTAFLCRDKPAMKEALREAGVPTAASTGSDDPDVIRAFAKKEGFPLILKPRGAAGAAGTYRVNDAAELDRVLAELGVGRGADVAVEEFVEGHEGFYDTLSLDGRPVHEFISHYYPNVLHAMRTRWISPQIVVSNRLAAPGYEEVRALGQKVIEVLGIGTSATHMEWFFGPKGLKFSEIGCRPPGVSVWDLYAIGNDFDIYREWGHLIAHGRPSQTRSQRFATGMINLRPDRDGRILGYEGVEEMKERFGPCLIDSHFPPPGSPTADVEGGYKVNAWVRAKHPDYDELRAVLTAIGETVKVRAG